jgi:hypothetical protein
MVSVGTLLMILLGVMLTIVLFWRYRKSKAKSYRNMFVGMSVVTVLMIVLVVALAAAR